MKVKSEKFSLTDFRVATNTFSQVAGRAVTILSSLASTVLLTRVLGVSMFGNYVFITSFVLVLIGLSDLGMTTVGVREASVKKGMAVKIFTNILTLRLIFSLVLFVLFVFLVNFLPQFKNLTAICLAASFAPFFLVFKTVAQGVLQTYLRLDLGALLEIFSAILYLVLLFALFLLGRFTLFTSMMLWSLTALFAAIAGILILTKFISLRIKIDCSLAPFLLKESLPLGLYLLIFSVYDRGIDSFLIKTFADSQAVGYYGLAYKIYGNIVLGAAFLMNSLFPMISSFRQKPPLLRSLFKKTFVFLFLAALLLFICFFFISPLVINLIAGRDFLISAIVLRILLLAIFFSYLNHLTGFYLVALGEQKNLLYFSLAGLGINLILNIIFIPRFSFWAAAGVTVLTEVVMFLLTYSFLRKRLGISVILQDFFVNTKLLFVQKQKYFEEIKKE